MDHHADAQAPGQAPSFLNPGPTGVTVYYLKLPFSSSSGPLISRFLVIGLNAGPPNPDISGLPGVVTKTYFKGEPAPPNLPPAPPRVRSILGELNSALERYGRLYDALDFEGVLHLP